MVRLERKIFLSPDDIEISPAKKVGGNRGIGLSFLVCYDTWGSGDSGCFTDSSMGNLEKGSFQNSGNYSVTLGWTMRRCSILLIGNRLERTALEISLLIS